jgi:hypothetical protein
MTDLKAFAIAAHGGPERWNGFTTASAHLLVGGTLWPLKRQPDHIAAHSKEQTFYFDSDGLLKRHDNIAEVIGAVPAAHYCAEYQECNGIMVPTKRRVYAIDTDGTVNGELMLVSIDLDQIKFE